MDVRFVCGWLVGWVEVFRRVSGGEGSVGVDCSREMLCYLGACNSKEEACQQCFCHYRYCYFNISVRLK